MRRITLWLLSTAAALILLFSYRTSTMGAGGDTAVATAAAAPRATATGGAAGDDTDSDDGASPTAPSSAAPSAAAPSPSAGSAGTSGNGSYPGSIAQTRWGPLQVTITVANGKITDVSVPTYPNGNHRDEEINAYALPILTQETAQNQNADVDTVSGATVTSDGYRESLQAAIDAAHLS